jgi:hypothetical protein
VPPLTANRQPSRSLRSRRSFARRSARSGAAQPRLNLLPVEITFEPVGDNEPITDNKKKAFDADGKPKPDEWMPGKGKRVFPDAKDKNDHTERNRVKVKVKTAPGAVENIYLKAFDVDDPTENDPDRIIDGNDGPQLKNGDDNKTIDNLGMPFPGVFAANESQSITLKVGSDGIATLPNGGDVEFIVGMQPGDNYRIAVAFKADDLNGLHVHSNVEAGYIKPSDDQPNGFNGVVSPMLTVWRKLYLEIDSMTAVPTSGDQKNFEEGTIETSSGSTLHLDISLTGPANRCENGHIDITGVGSFTIVSNTDNVAFDDDDVVVNGTPGSAAVGKTFKIYDDDDKYLSTLGLPAPLPKNGDHATIINGIQTKFAPAYIQIEDASALGWNPNQTVNFYLNAPGAGLFGANVWDGAKDLPSSTDKFWTWLVVYGYQPSDPISHPIDPNAIDGDPDSENRLLGVTPAQRFGGARFGYSVVFAEVVRDSALGGSIAVNLQLPLVANAYRKTLRDLLLGTTAHEMGHGPSNGSNDEDHAEGGLMQDGAAPISGVGSDFTPKTINRFRERSQW